MTSPAPLTRALREKQHHEGRAPRRDITTGTEGQPLRAHTWTRTGALCPPMHPRAAHLCRGVQVDRAHPVHPRAAHLCRGVQVDSAKGWRHHVFSNITQQWLVSVKFWSGL